jgi:hypothetical protein
LTVVIVVVCMAAGFVMGVLTVHSAIVPDPPMDSPLHVARNSKSVPSAPERLTFPATILDTATPPCGHGCYQSSLAKPWHRATAFELGGSVITSGYL